MRALHLEPPSFQRSVLIFQSIFMATHPHPAALLPTCAGALNSLPVNCAAFFLTLFQSC
jgi:hypothetical protein